MMPMLTDQDVRERMDWLTANGFPGTETVQRTKEFVKYARGPSPKAQSARSFRGSRRRASTSSCGST